MLHLADISTPRSTPFPASDTKSNTSPTTGTILSGPDAARRHAATLAAELAQDGENYRGYTVYIVDEYGSDIGKVRVVAAPYDSAG